MQTGSAATGLYNTSLYATISPCSITRQFQSKEIKAGSAGDSRSDRIFSRYSSAKAVLHQKPKYATIDDVIFNLKIAMNKIVSLAVCFAFLSLCAACAEETRTWTVSHEAKFIGMSEDGKSVILQYADEKKETIPLEKLSLKDQLYLADETSKIQGKRDFVKDAKATVPLTQTFKDAEYGFSFQYPEGWEDFGKKYGHLPQVRVQVGSFRIEILPPEENLLKKTKEDIMKEIRDEIIQAEMRIPPSSMPREMRPYTSSTVQYIGVHQFDGRECLYYITRTHWQRQRFPEPETLSILDSVIIKFPYKDKTFCISTSYSPANFHNDRLVFESILSSFRFE
jgi:hypothetical protein